MGVTQRRGEGDPVSAVRAGGRWHHVRDPAGGRVPEAGEALRGGGAASPDHHPRLPHGHAAGEARGGIARRGVWGQLCASHTGIMTHFRENPLGNGRGECQQRSPPVSLQAALPLPVPVPAVTSPYLWSAVASFGFFPKEE